VGVPGFGALLLGAGLLTRGAEALTGVGVDAFSTGVVPGEETRAGIFGAGGVERGIAGASCVAAGRGSGVAAARRGAGIVTSLGRDGVRMVIPWKGLMAAGRSKPSPGPSCRIAFATAAGTGSSGAGVGSGCEAAGRSFAGLGGAALTGGCGR
jgi:hypothetical protein